MNDNHRRDFEIVAGAVIQVIKSIPSGVQPVHWWRLTIGGNFRQRYQPGAAAH